MCARGSGSIANERATRLAEEAAKLSLSKMAQDAAKVQAVVSQADSSLLFSPSPLLFS